MLSLPGAPLQPITFRPTNDHPRLVRQVLSSRHQLRQQTNTAAYISELEDYLNAIVEALSDEGYVYVKALEHGEDLVLCDGTVPWMLCTKNKREHGEHVIWSLKDEIVMVCCNISLGYVKRVNELMVQFRQTHDDKFWVNAFKLLKRGLEYTEYVKDNCVNTDSTIWESSLPYVRFIESVVNCSIQYTFLSKCLWKLKSTEYNVIDGEINYSTLSRIAIFIKSELLTLIKDSRYHRATEWSEYLEIVLKLVNGIIGAFVSVENYKQDKIGVAIGFLNLSITNITSKLHNFEDGETIAREDDDLKFKNKFSILKQKINDKSNKLKSRKKISFKINTSIQSRLPEGLRSDYTNLFKLTELLHLKYHLENDNLKFEKIIAQEELINYTPLGRAVPVDITPWKPTGSSISAQVSSGQGGYY